MPAYLAPTILHGHNAAFRRIAAVDDAVLHVNPRIAFYGHHVAMPTVLKPHMESRPEVSFTHSGSDFPDSSRNETWLVESIVNGFSPERAMHQRPSTCTGRKKPVADANARQTDMDRTDIAGYLMMIFIAWYFSL